MNQPRERRYRTPKHQTLQDILKAVYSGQMHKSNTRRLRDYYKKVGNTEMLATYQEAYEIIYNKKKKKKS